MQPDQIRPRIGRRAFGAVLSASLLPALEPARAQPANPRIAIPLGGEQFLYLVDALKQGMREQGIPDGSVEYDVGFTLGEVQREERVVADLLARRPAAIVIAGPPFVRAALKLTRTVPIVMANVSNPVGNGFIDSLARPGGNVTGVATLYETVLPKVAEVLVEIVPSASRIAMLLNESSPSTGSFWQAVEAALRTLGRTPIRMKASSEAQVGQAFDEMREARVQAAIVVADVTFVSLRDRIAAMAKALQIPTAYAMREHVLAGGLVSYGPSMSGNFHAAARYVAQILKGARPADLPVEQPTRFELVLNRGAARSLGLRIPSSVMLRVDEVIE